MSEFKSVTKDVCKLPSFFSMSLFRKIDVNSTGLVRRYALLVIVGESNLTVQLCCISTAVYYIVILTFYLVLWILQCLLPLSISTEYSFSNYWGKLKYLKLFYLLLEGLGYPSIPYFKGTLLCPLNWTMLMLLAPFPKEWFWASFYYANPVG
jgi:hypothetical protein